MGLAVVPFRFFNPVLAAKIKKNVGTALFGIPFFLSGNASSTLFSLTESLFGGVGRYSSCRWPKEGKRKLHTPSGIAQIRSVKRLLGML